MGNLIMLAADFKVCSSLTDVWTIIGYVVLAFRVLIPILLIVFGMIDLGKAVIASKPEEISKSVRSFAYRAVAAIVVFLIPTIVGVLLNLLSAWTTDTELQNEYEVCKNCILHPSSCGSTTTATTVAE